MDIKKTGHYLQISGIDQRLFEEERKIRSHQSTLSPSQGEPHIIRQGLAPHEAFKKFTDNELQQISMYTNLPNPLVSRETPLERLTRLQAELREFKQDMKLYAQREKQLQIKNNTIESDAQIIKQIDSLEQELQALQNTPGVTEILQSGKINENISIDSHLSLMKKDVQNNLTDEIINQLKNFQESSEVASSSVRLEIFMDQDANQISEVQQFIELEKRISGIETIIGADQIKDNEGREIVQLISRIDSLQQSVALLNPASLDKVRDQIEQLNSDLETISQQKTNEALSPEDVQKVDDLYNKYLNVEGVANELPIIVDRLESLKILHEESAAFMIQINQLTNVHNQIIVELGTNQELIQKTEENFLANMKVVQNNIQNLEDRIKKLETK